VGFPYSLRAGAHRNSQRIVWNSFCCDISASTGGARFLRANPLLHRLFAALCRRQSRCDIISTDDISIFSTRPGFPGGFGAHS
jgi:hypothetical protein